ncbi:MAG: DMT family transporter [Marmoricola sp.]
MTSLVVATLFGLLASFLFALAAYLQQKAARETHPHGHTILDGAVALMATLLRHKVWLLGWAVNIVGFGAQAVGLHLGSVAAVQPLLATQLLFALPMSSLENKRWPRLRDWGSALAICAGLVILLIVVHATPLQGNADRTGILIAAAAVLVTIAILVPVSLRVSRRLMAVVSAACAGLCFAMTAVFLTLTGNDLVNHGILYTATDWVGYALAASTLLGLVLEQIAFANGPLPWAVATKESVNPIASYAVGVLVFPVSLAASTGTLAGIAGAGALLVVGAIGLAESPSSELWRQRDEALPDGTEGRSGGGEGHATAPAH